jgi:O-antigen/teichoic acid export membrane protein
MPHDARLALRRARRTGVLICGVALAGAALFVAGLAQGSYWALAIPVTLAVLGALSLAFWIGYTINTVRGIPPEAEPYEGRHARRVAAGICVVSVALAAGFLWGVAQHSYWALALPVGAAVLGLAGMVFWIGWAIVTQRRSLPESAAPAGAQPAGDPSPPAEAPPADERLPPADAHP